MWKGWVKRNDGRNWRGGRSNLARLGHKRGNDAGQTEKRSESGKAVFRLGDRMAGARETISPRVPQGETSRAVLWRWRPAGGSVDLRPSTRTPARRRCHEKRA